MSIVQVLKTRRIKNKIQMKEAVNTIGIRKKKEKKELECLAPWPPVLMSRDE